MWFIMVWNVTGKFMNQSTYHWFIKPIVCLEGYLVFISFVNVNIVVPPSYVVKFGVDMCIAQVVNEI